MNNEELYVLRQHIACLIDYPSVFMGGPSQGSTRKAIEIINLIMERCDMTAKEELKKSSEHVAKWRTTSLNEQ